MRGHFERHASSNGRKYLSASTWSDFARGIGNAAEPVLLSEAPLYNRLTENLVSLFKQKMKGKHCHHLYQPICTTSMLY